MSHSLMQRELMSEFVCRVPNAISGRDDLDVEVYGMEGVPEEIIYEKSKMIRCMSPFPPLFYIS